MKASTPFQPEHDLPSLKSPSRRALLTGLILVLYFGFATATMRTNRPDVDDAAFANPCYNLIHYGFMGTTVYGEHGLMPLESLMRHTYWAPPLYFLTNSAFFKIVGFGFFRVRFPSALWGLLALVAWYVFLRAGGNSSGLSLLVAGFISIGYFFQLGAALGRMDMMCLALGTAGLAIYSSLRRRNLAAAIFAGNALVVCAGLTHAVGVIYFCGLQFLTVALDWKDLRLRHMALAAIPYLVGAVGWGAYILEDPAGFREQMHGNLAVTSGAAGITPGFAPIQALKAEIARRYGASFGLGTGVGWANRAKAILLVGYAAGLIGILWLKRLRHDRFLRNLAILAVLDFFVMAFVATSKNYYYLPHTTAVFSACLALLLLRAPAPGSRGQAMGMAVLGGLALLQMAGLALRDRADDFHKSYLPAVRVIRANSQPDSLIFGPAEMWLYLVPDRELIHDWTLGYKSGRAASLIVMDPMLRQMLDGGRIEHSLESQRVDAILERTHKIYDDGYYAVYQPTM
jgi:hypothetical protein